MVTGQFKLKFSQGQWSIFDEGSFQIEMTTKLVGGFVNPEQYLDGVILPRELRNKQASYTCAALQHYSNSIRFVLPDVTLVFCALKDNIWDCREKANAIVEQLGLSPEFMWKSVGDNTFEYDTSVFAS